MDAKQLAAGELQAEHASSDEIRAYWLERMRQTLADAMANDRAKRAHYDMGVGL